MKVCSLLSLSLYLPHFRTCFLVNTQQAFGKLDQMRHPTPPRDPDSASGCHLLWYKLTNPEDSPSHLRTAPRALLHHGNSVNWGSLLFSELNISIFVCACSVIQSCPTLCDPVDCSPSGSSVHGTSQAGILEWVAISFSRGSSQYRD